MTSWITSRSSFGDPLRCWIIYDIEDVAKNGFFAERLRLSGESLGMDTSVVTTDSLPEDVPDVVVSRQRNWTLSRRLESEGALVVNGSEVCRICNDKLETYRMAESLGIPYLRCSLPGDDLPPGPPWIVKSRSGHGGKQVSIAKDPDDLESQCGRIADALIQEVAPVLGRDMRAYVLDGEIIACVMRSSETDFRANFSLGGKAELCEPPEECIGIIQKIAGRLTPTFVGVDFTFGDDCVYLNEVEDVVGTRMLYSLTNLDPARILMENIHSKSSL